MKKKTGIKIFCISGLIILVFITFYLTDVAKLTVNAIEYNFIEAQEFEPENWIKFGTSVTYINGHKSDCVEIAINNSRRLDNFNVYLDGDYLIIIYEESNDGLKKDRLFFSNSVKNISTVMDNIKVYKNGRRVYLVEEIYAIE